MTPKEILEGNKLIAEFMGMKESVIKRGSLVWNEKNILIDKNELKYHSSWDWLMPVVERIESLDKLGGVVRIIQGQCKITSRMLGDSSVYADKSNYMLMGVKGKLLSTYEAVVEFIKWYNQQKIKNKT